MITSRRAPILALMSLAAMVAGSQAAAQLPVASPVAQAPAAGPGPITLDDILRLEDFSGAMFARDGSRFAFQRARSIAELRGTAYDAAGFDDRTVHIVDTRTGHNVQVTGSGPEERFSLAPWSGAFSPSGRLVALRAARPDRAGVAIWDAERRRARWLPGGLSGYFFANAWTPDDRLIYAAAPEGEGARPTVAVAEALADRWRATSAGATPQVTVVSSNPGMPSSERAPGDLLLAGRNGAVTRLAQGDYTMVSVAPGGRHFAAIRRAEPSRGATFDAEGRRGELQVFELIAQGATLKARFAQEDLSPLGLSWSEDGSALLAAGVSPGEERAQIFRLDVARNTLQHLQTDDLLLQSPGGIALIETLPIGWVGATPLFVGGRAATEPPGASSGQAEGGLRFDYGQQANLRFDLWALTPEGPQNLTAFSPSGATDFADPPGYGAAFVVADGALWRVAPGADPQRLTRPDALPVIGFARPPGQASRWSFSRFDDSRRTAYLMVVREGRPVQASLDLLTGAITPFAPGSTILAAAPDFAFRLTREADREASVLTLSGPGRTFEVARINAFLNARTPGQLISIPYRVGDQNLTAWAIRPPGLPEGQRAPAVAFVYGGLVWGAEPPPFAQVGHRPHIFNGQLLAAQGYLVLYPSLPLQPGTESDVMALLAESTSAAVAAAAEQGLVDPDRVAIMGQSFGGYSTAAILARSGWRFRTGIAVAGIFSLPTIYGSRGIIEMLRGDPAFWPGTMIYTERGQLGLQRPLWEGAEGYVRNSPLFHASDIEAPLLIVQGDIDGPLTSLYGAEQMYAALVRAGRSPVLLRYWGEGHVAHSEANIRDQWQRIGDWLALHLQHR